MKFNSSGFSINDALEVVMKPGQEFIQNRSYSNFGKEGLISESHFAPVGLTLLSTIGTIAVLCFTLSTESEKRSKNANFGYRSTILPGYGILGDTVNEIVEMFLDTLAIYVHNDKQWDCSRRMLCEANQRASDYGTGYGMLTYLLSLSVSFLLRNQRVSESMEAMRRGRHGMDCKSSYPHCPFSL